MFPEFEFETLTAPVASFYAALALGVLFGVLAEQTKFRLLSQQTKQHAQGQSGVK